MPNANSKKVLIVEDESFLSEMYQTKFDSLGYTVVTAENGEEGIEKMRQEKPDIVLLDILMPVIDGYEVLKRVRADEELKNILIVIFSNLGQEEEITKGLQLGADDYLVKSNLTPTELIRKVEIVMANGRSNKSVAKKIRILMIEDTQDIIEIYKKRFDMENFEMKVAENGAWGLKVAQSEPFDIILLDIMMPEINGLEALKTLRGTPKLKDVPILVFSNSVEDDVIEQVRAAGATEIYLKARVTPTQVVNRIRELVGV